MSMPSTQAPPMSPHGSHRGATSGPAARPSLRQSRTSFGARDSYAQSINEDTLNAILHGAVDPLTMDRVVRNQQNALQALNYDFDTMLSQAIQVSEETAALEARRRREAQPAASTSTSQSSTSDDDLARALRISEETAALEARRWRESSQSGASTSTPQVSANDDDLAKALRISEETAALEARRRHQASKASQPVASTSQLPSPPLSSASTSRHTADKTNTQQLRRADSVQPTTTAGPSASAADRTRSVQQQKASVPTSSATPASRAPSTSSRPPLRSVVTELPSSSSSRPRDIPSSRQSQHRRSNVSGSSDGSSRQLSREPSSSTRQYTSERAPLKRAPASARDLRVGLSMSPDKEDLDSYMDAKRSRRSISPDHEPSKNRDLFTGARNCSHCNALIVSPRALLIPSESLARQVTDLLHVRCESCATTHCRGCFTTVQCPRRCPGGDSCAVKNCCTQVRAIAIFEALSSFDNEYATQARLVGWSTKDDRWDYLQLVLSSVDKRVTQRFEKILLPTVCTLSSWLLADDVRREGGLHPTVQRLFAVSYVSEVMRAFLTSGRPIKDWVAYSGSYVGILQLLRRMVECGLSPLFTEPQIIVERSCGIHSWIWEQGTITWVSDARDQPVRSPPLCQLVKQLFPNLKPLRELADKIQFPQTVEKANDLYYGLSYLMMLEVIT